MLSEIKVCVKEDFEYFGVLFLRNWYIALLIFTWGLSLNYLLNEIRLAKHFDDEKQEV